jgi:hypothetical protein
VLLLVLRLLAVYFATAAAAILIAHRYVSPIRFRVGLALALAPFLLTGKALVTAGVHGPIDIAYQAPPLSALADQMGTRVSKTPILSDVTAQMIPWRKAVREAVKNGRLPLWNRFVLAGEPLLAVQQPAAFHPATWIGFLLPLAQAWTFEMALRYYAASLFAYLFLRGLECGEIPALLGAAGWAFCDYQVFFLGHPHSAAAAPFPLLLLGLSRLVREANLRAVAVNVVALLLIAAAGHPETLLHSVAGGGVYFLFELGLAEKGRRLKPLLLSLLAGALALGLSAPLLLPFAEVLPHTWEHYFREAVFSHIRKSLPPRESLLHAAQNAMPYAYGVSGKGEPPPGFAEPSSYAGTVLWPFAVLGLLSRRREKWALVAIAFLGLAAGVRLAGIADAVSAPPLFDIALNERMVFLAAFAIAALAALGLERAREESRSSILAGFALAGASLVTALYVTRARWHVSPLTVTHGYFEFRFLLQLAPLLLVTALWLLPRRRGLPGLVAGGVLLLLVAQRGLEEGGFTPTYPSRAFYPALRLLDSIPRGVPERLAAVGFSFTPNIAALYEVEDVRGYETMTFRPLFDTYPLWCVHQPVWSNRVDDPTRPFLAFLNVRYVLEPPDSPLPAGWPVLYSGEEGVALENPKALTRAFVPRFLAYEPDAARRLGLLGGITDFGDRGVVGQAPPMDIPAGAWHANGEASVVVSSYHPQDMTLEINAKQAALVGTSVTAWPGWKLAVDGAAATLVPYNHAFLGFRVSAGRHTAVLRYRPDGFVRGSAASAATLLLCVILFVRVGRAARG